LTKGYENHAQDVETLAEDLAVFAISVRRSCHGFLPLGEMRIFNQLVRFPRRALARRRPQAGLPADANRECNRTRGTDAREQRHAHDKRSAADVEPLDQSLVPLLVGLP
jgi:hypothetical protein